MGKVKASEQTFIFKPQDRDPLSFRENMLRVKKDDLEGKTMFFQGVYHKGKKVEQFVVNEKGDLDETQLFATTLKYTTEGHKSYHIPVRSLMGSDMTESTVAAYTEATRKNDSLKKVSDSMDAVYEEAINAIKKGDGDTTEEEEAVTIKFPASIKVRLVADFMIAGDKVDQVQKWPAYEYKDIVSGLKEVAKANIQETEEVKAEAVSAFYREKSRDIFAKGKSGLLPVYTRAKNPLPLPETIKELVIQVL